MKKLILFMIIILTVTNCDKKEEIEKVFHPRAIVIIKVGNVKIGNKQLSLGDEVSDQDWIKLGSKSICDLQLLDSDSTVVIRLKENTKFKLSGKQIGLTKETNFLVEFGKTMFNVTKLGKNDAIQVKSPVSTVGVRGTKYDFDVKQHGSTQVNVLEGSVAMKVRIPELDEYSKTEIKKSEALNALDDSLQTKKIIINKGQTSEMPREVKTKILKETGLEEGVKKHKLEDMEQSVDLEKIEKIKNEELNVPVQKMNQRKMNQRLGEYAQLTPISNQIINDKSKRDKIIKARFKKWEKTWFQKLLDWGREKLKFF